MVLITSLSSKLNRVFAPSLLRLSLSTRYKIGRGIIRDNPTLDSFLLIPFAQSLISIETQYDAMEAVEASNQTIHDSDVPKKPTKFDQFVDYVWDRFLESRAPPPSSDTITKSSSSNHKKQKVHTSTPHDKDDYNPQLEVFEKYIRPVLVPNNQWGPDVKVWIFHQRFIKWVRKEYLLAKYTTDLHHTRARYPDIFQNIILNKSSSSQISNFENMSLLKSFYKSKNNHKSTTFMNNRKPQLPTQEMVLKAFQMHSWNRHKDHSLDYSDMERILNEKISGASITSIPNSNLRVPNIPYDQDISELSLEEILEVTGCHVMSCGSFNAYCELFGIYEFWTKEYVVGLAGYLLERCLDFDGETIIVDIGAGDGVLAHYLREYIVSNSNHQKKKRRKASTSQLNKDGSIRNGFKVPQIIATDDGSWNIKPKADVEISTIEQALKKYSPIRSDGITKEHQLIVICSWMPMGVDWSQQIRSFGADEYILIGECDDGNCGHNWYTWGNVDFHTENIESPTSSQNIAPYVVDGFERIDHHGLSSLQFSRFDSKNTKESKTVSFKRK